MSSIAATVAFKAGRWPIRTLALVSAFVFAVYVASVELNPSALPAASLARSYLVDSASHWSPISAQSDYPADLPHFIGCSVVFPAQHRYQSTQTSDQQLAAARAHVAAVLAADLPLSSDRESEKTMRAAGADEFSPVVFPAAQLSAAREKLNSFEVNGQLWELKSPQPSWLAYSRYYMTRITELAREASYFDIGLISAGWAGMYYTFLHLFLQLRTLGSRSFLFLAALMSSGLGFLLAYAATSALGFSVPKLALVQGLPFLVLVVGFNNKVRLAREALLNPEQVSAAEAVKRSVQSQFFGFAREAALEAGVMVLVGLSTSIPTLFEFSLLSVLVLALDLVLLVTFFAATLSLKVAMVQVDRNDAVRRALQEDGVARDVASAYADEVLHSSRGARAAKFTRFRWLGGSVRLLLVFAFLAVNWVKIVQFPISFSIHVSDLADVQVGDVAQRLPVPAIFTVIPALQFAPVTRSTFLLGQAWSLLHSAPATMFVALVLSLACNGYLAGMVMRQSSIPLVVTPGSPNGAAKEELEGIPLGSAGSAISGASAGAGSVGGAASRGSQVAGRPRTTSLSLGGDGSVAGSTPLLSRGSTGSALASHGAAIDEEYEVRTEEECALILKNGGAPTLNNEELIGLAVSGKLPLYALEKQLKDTTRAVVVRRAAVSRLSTTQTLESSDLPWKDYNYDRVLGACCENVIGVMPLPLGVAGPVIIDGEEFYLPMATTEGVLVASTMRGCKALNAGGGVATEILGDGMTRGPCVTFSRASRAAACKIFLDSDEGYKAMERAFNSTSRFARLTALKTSQAGVFLYIRFRAQTGDAMGMNMISKGTERALQVLAEECGFEDMTIVSVSGNFCTDKKAAAINWIEGRGKSVVAEAIVPGDKVRSILKTGVDELVELNMAKNLVGSSMAGAMGGFNAHAANLVAAVFLATGQDPAQVVEGSNCMTLMSNVDGDLQISVTMPSLEVGTIGGGTILEPQAAMLNMLGVRGPNVNSPGDNARQLARIVATAVLAGELSLNSALAAGHLVKSHMEHNRAKPAK